MNKKEYDVIIIGAGMGGLICGAILAKEERAKVLVVEKLTEIGGRILTFGKQHGTDYSTEQFEKLLMQGVWSHAYYSEPDLKTIIEKKKVFHDYILEGGWHAMSGADRCRYALIAKSLGKTIPVKPVIGMAYWEDGKWFQMPEFTRHWPKSSHDERKRVAYKRQLISVDEAAEYDHMSLKMFMESMTDDELVKDYYYMLAAWQYGINDMERVSAGEWIKCQNATAAVGRHLIYGGGMGEVVGGIKTVADIFASIIEENGGEVRTGCRVKEVVIKNWKAQGVVMEEKNGSEEIKARNVVSSVPPTQGLLYKIIDEKYFPEELKQRIDSWYPLGALTGFCVLKEQVETEYPKGQWLAWLPNVGDLNPVGGRLCFGMEQTDLIDPSRCPEDRCLLQVCVILSRKGRDEVGDLEFMNKLGDRILDFLRNQYPQFDSILDWYYFTRHLMVYPIEDAPGMVWDRRLPPQHPGVRNLFFTGDGAKKWDVGSNGAAHAAVITASALSGRNYLKLLPPYWR